MPGPSSRPSTPISIVANDVSRDDAGFDVETNAVTIVGAEGAEALPLQSKAGVAAGILDRVEQLLDRPWTPISSGNTCVSPLSSASPA